ncbi:MAG: DsbA family protein [Candidatus Tokpelaia sp.]|nr:MAG: DsbA family protein [Candidatus Tokpelaia sp.]KAA6207558.1 MAG: DsbA family protein [Candidatus Tokpelaia sp.]
MILCRKSGRAVIFSLCLSACFSIISPGLVPAAPAEGAMDIEAIKKALLDDPLFLSHLHDRISADSINTDIIRQYLLKNPEILVEMQEVLAANANKQAQTLEEQTKILQENQQILYHTANDIILGDKNAPIVFLEFFDYNCGYCKRDFPEEKKLVAAHKNVRIIMKDYPILSDDSAQAHLVAQAVKKLAPEKYPAFHEKMMGLKGRATQKTALATARSLGLNIDSLQEKMRDPDTQQAMLASAQIAYRLGLNYAPVFILGTKILGAVNMQNLPQIIAEEEQRLAGSK